MTQFQLKAGGLRYQRYGSSNKTQCVFFIPGFGDGSGGFQPLIDHVLRVGFKAIAIDLPGCGSNADVVVGVGQAADLIHAIIQQEAGVNNLIVAHSLGGLLTLRVASQSSKCRINGLFLIEATLLEPDHSFFLSLDLACADPVKKFASLLDSNAVPASYLPQYKQNVSRMSKKMFATYAQNVIENLPLERDLLLSLTTSIMYVYGAESPSQSEREALAVRPNITIKRVTNSTHWPHIDATDYVISCLKIFLAKVIKEEY